MRRILPAVLSLALLLSACGGDAREELQAYLRESDAIGDELAETGARFETLMNVQGQISAWTPAEKEELDGIVEAMDGLVERAEDIDPPESIADIHPLLVQAITEMRAAILDVITVAEDPDAATAELAASIDAHATAGKRLGDEYLARLSAVVRAEAEGTEE